MIAKNVGIRRARGKYVLATNIDVLFSDELFMCFKKKKLKPGILYRTNRLDIPAEIPNQVFFDQVLDHCKRNFFRINGWYGTKIVKDAALKKQNAWYKIYWGKIEEGKDFLLRIIREQEYRKKLIKARRLLKTMIRKSRSKNLFDISKWRTFLNQILSKANRKKSNRRKDFFKNLKREIQNCFFKVKKNRFVFFPHTNGCGDFTLLARADWEALRGYPEWPIFSWHLDSLFLYQAFISNKRQKNFASAKPIYHIEHAKGSGYTPEGVDILFKRLKEKGVPYLDTSTLDHLVEELRERRGETETPIYNTESWGLNHHKLEERTL